MRTKEVDKCPFNGSSACSCSWSPVYANERLDKSCVSCFAEILCHALQPAMQAFIFCQNVVLVHFTIGALSLVVKFYNTSPQNQYKLSLTFNICNAALATKT